MNAQEVLSKDPKMKILVDLIPQSALHIPGQKSDIREYLVSSIISQQLSVKVAKVIFTRFLELFGGKFPRNLEIINTPIDRLRSIGLSAQKSQYIKNIAEFFEIHKLHKKDWKSLPDEEIAKLLIQIKGVGVWTTEMVLMFGLCREDVFSSGDYGIQMAMKKLYKLKQEGKELQHKMLRIAEKWRPHRSLACMYLWTWKDLKE
ncbi:MAG: DNA-3-methyladenine glycosylase 2 family protein [Saprospiraceae bacterium]|nr:DNA-3-methyladenine glycosylase 2 family protein [Saprospiraceae bacterium]